MAIGTLTLCNLDRAKSYSDMGPAAAPVFKVDGAVVAPPHGFGQRDSRTPGGRLTCVVVAEHVDNADDVTLEVSVEGSGSFEIAYLIAE